MMAGRHAPSVWRVGVQSATKASDASESPYESPSSEVSTVVDIHRGGFLLIHPNPPEEYKRGGHWEFATLARGHGQTWAMGPY